MIEYSTLINNHIEREENLTKPFFKLLILFFVSVIIAYFLPAIFSRIYFIVLSVFFAFSKNDRWWIAFIFVTFNAPAGLFSGGGAEDIGRLPYIPFPFGSFAIAEVFLLIAFFKALRKKEKFQTEFNTFYLILLIYFIIQIFQTIFMGYDFKNFVITSRQLYPLLFFYLIPKLVKDLDEFEEILILIIPFILLDFMGQIYELIFGQRINVTLGGISPSAEYTGVQYETDLSEIYRVKISAILNLCAFWGAFYFIDKKKKFKYNFLYLIIIICFISVFLSATRGWILAYVFFILFYFLLNFKKIQAKIFPLSIALVIIYVFLYTYFPFVFIQLENALRRLTTIEFLLEGDPSAGGTLFRLTERAPAVMKYFYESPIFGWAFSTNVEPDGHVGNHNLLMQAGIIGYLLFMIFYIGVIYKLKLMSKRDLIYKNVYYVFILTILVIFIIHSTSSQMIGYDVGFNSYGKNFFLGFFFALVSAFIKNRKNELIK